MESIRHGITTSNADTPVSPAREKSLCRADTCSCDAPLPCRDVRPSASWLRYLSAVRCKGLPSCAPGRCLAGTSAKATDGRTERVGDGTFGTPGSRGSIGLTDRVDDGTSGTSWSRGSMGETGTPRVGGLMRVGDEVGDSDSTFRSRTPICSSFPSPLGFSWGDEMGSFRMPDSPW